MLSFRFFVVLLLSTIIFSTLTLAQQFNDAPPGTETSIPNGDLANIFHGSSGVSSGTVTNREETVDISEANSYNAPNKAQKVSNSGKMSLDKKGNIKTIESAGEIETETFDGTGIENADLETGTISQAVEVRDDTGFTLDNSQEVKIQKQTVTADVETTEGDYYQTNQQTVITARKTDLNTPNRIYSQNTNNLYYNGRVLTFDKSNNIVLPTTKTTLSNLGQTQILFNGDKPIQITTALTKGTATTPNPLSPDNYFALKSPTFQTTILRTRTDANGNKIEEEKTFTDLKEFVKYLSDNTKTFVVDGRNTVLEQIKEAMKQQTNDQLLFSLTQTGYDNCKDCVITFKGKPNDKIVMKLDKIPDGKATYEIPKGMNLTFGNNAPNVEEAEIPLTIYALNDSAITITNEPNGNKLIEATNAEVNREYGNYNEIARCSKITIEQDNKVDFQAITLKGNPCIYFVNYKDSPASHYPGKPELIKANETPAQTYALYKDFDGDYEIHKTDGRPGEGIITKTQEYAILNTLMHSIKTKGRITYQRLNYEIGNIMNINGIKYLPVKSINPVLTTVWKSYDLDNSLNVQLDANNIMQSIKLENKGGQNNGIKCSSNFTLFEFYSGPYKSTEECQDKISLLRNAKNAELLIQSKLPQRFHEFIKNEKPRAIANYQSDFGLKTKFIKYEDGALISYGNSVFGDNGVITLTAKGTKAQEDILNKRDRYIASKKCLV